MQIESLMHRFCLMVSVVTAYFLPFTLLHADIISDLSISELSLNSHSPHSHGTLVNGLSFSLIPSTQENEGVLALLACAAPNESNTTLPLLYHHASFYATQQWNKEALQAELNDLGLDIHADGHLSIYDGQTVLHFSLPYSNEDKILRLCNLINQISLHPKLSSEDIEMARNHILDLSPDSTGLTSTTDEIRQYHDEWLKPENMHLILYGKFNLEKLNEMIAEAFSSPIDKIYDVSPANYDDSVSQAQSESIFPSLMNRIEFTQENKTWSVDGKIWLNEPNWINKSFNGRLFGAFLTAVGIGGGILALPIMGPAAVLGGMSTAATGIYFMTSNYFKDPSYVESMRKIDLVEGFHYAYSHRRAGITLTPYERRALFLQEMVQYSYRLPQSPILLLVDFYRLNDPVMAEMFTYEEFSILQKIKQDFILERNQFKFLEERLNQELATATTPFALIRDAALARARESYNSNPFVIAKNELTQKRDAIIAEAERAFQKHIISSEVKKNLIDDANADYERLLNEPELKAQLQLAETTLRNMESEIQTAYELSVQLCKQAIHFDERITQLKMGKEGLVHYFNHELCGLLGLFPVYLSSLPDYIDLRF